jgi:hypothetical protein
MTTVAKFDESAARDLDEQIRALAKHAHVVIEALHALVAQAQANDIHLTLGYPSWTAYLADALDGQWKIEKDKRGEVVKFLASQGMSQRAISKLAGISKGTVYRELTEVPQLGQVIGLDGKTYTRLPGRDEVPQLGQETDEEWMARKLVESEASRNADGRRTLTIPATIEGADALLTQLFEDERRIHRIMFRQAFAALETQPAGYQKDVLWVGLQLRWMRTNVEWFIDDGLSIEKIAETMGTSVAMVEDYLDVDGEMSSDADYFKHVMSVLSTT